MAGETPTVHIYVEMHPAEAECLERWLSDGGFWADTTLSVPLLFAVSKALQRYRALVRLAEIEEQMAALQEERDKAYRMAYS